MSVIWLKTSTIKLVLTQLIQWTMWHTCILSKICIATASLWKPPI